MYLLTTVPAREDTRTSYVSKENKVGENEMRDQFHLKRDGLCRLLYFALSNSYIDKKKDYRSKSVMLNFSSTVSYQS